MYIQFQQEIYYSNKEHVPLSEIAKSLLALEKAAAAAPRALELLYKDVVPQGVQIYVDELQSGSLSEKLKYYVRLAFQKQMGDEFGVEPNLLEIQSESKKQDIAAWVIAAILVMAIQTAKDKFFPGTSSVHIEQQVNVTLQAGRDITGIDEQTLRNVIKQAVQENPEAMKGAVGFVKPAKLDPEASIQIDKKPYLSSQAILEIPSSIPDEPQNERALELTNTTIAIRATDKDSSKKGWAATIAEYSEKRMRLHIAPGVDLNYLAHHDVVVGNVTIFYSIDDTGKVYKPHAHLFSIDKEATKALGEFKVKE